MRINVNMAVGVLLLVAANVCFSSARSSTLWRPLKVGAGGFVTGIDISPDGSTRVVRTDTYGAYIWDFHLGQWSQLVTAVSMPAADVGVDKNAGVYELRVAPSLPTRLFMAYRGAVYRSDDRGGHWIRTSFAAVPMDANDDFRTTGPKMAVDPANPDIVYIGTLADGVFFTIDGGSSWAPIKEIPSSRQAPNGRPGGHPGITFDVSSGVNKGKTNVIYVPSYGNGVYRSVDAGASWTLLANGPEDVGHAKIAKDGAYYAVGDRGSAIWRYQHDAWTNITPPGGGWATVVTDPFDPARVIAATQGGLLDVSGDRGADWGGLISGPGYNHRIARDIPWLAWTNERFMSNGDMVFDPAQANRLWFAEGIGVWVAEVPRASRKPESTTFTSQSKGIEQLVANEVISPPGGRPIVASWDRPVFRIGDPDAYSQTHAPDNEYPIVMGWALDYASTEPRFVVALMNWWGIEKSGFSTDGGETWTAFPSRMPGDNGKIGGGIAASTPRNIVWAPSNNSPPYYTLDGGSSWKEGVFEGANAPGDAGWGFAYYLNRHIVAADRVATGIFYIYNNLRGLYRSSDGGATWALVYGREIAPFSGYNAELKAAPGQRGHLFFTSGAQGGPLHPAATPFMRSTNGGETWSVVRNVREVRAFGFGRALSSGYPTIYICGWVNRVYGLWKSTDNARSWEEIGRFPLGSLDDVTTVDGDKNVEGVVYIGFRGSGYAYGIEQEAAAPVTEGVK